MVSLIKNCSRTTQFILEPPFSFALYHASAGHFSAPLSSLFNSCPAAEVENSQFLKPNVENQVSRDQSEIDILVSKIRVGESHSEIIQSLVLDQECNSIQISHDLVDRLLFRFKDDWKSALGVFKWVELRGYKPAPEAYDRMVDILGKMKQMSQMKAFLEEMRKINLVTLDTVGKAMRRFSGARQWENAVRVFDKLGTYGLEKNTESMNLLLDTLCKEGYVEHAREIFWKLKSHISPDANTFNIFIHGWCKANRFDEAYWTIQEMKGNGCCPCVISYSTIIQYCCRRGEFGKVYELLDEMEAQGSEPNVVTYTSVMSAMAKLGEYEEAIQISQRMKSVGCKPDTFFYNSLIHTLGRAGKQDEAIRVFEVEMPNAGVPRSTSTYNIMIAMFCRQGLELKALNLLREMGTSTICKPDVQSYYPFLKSCLRNGKIDCLLNQFLDDMVKKHHLSLNISAYTLLIHGLCRANKCEWAYSLFEEMIDKDMKPRYRTCRLILDEVKERHMYEAAEKIETVMKGL